MYVSCQQASRVVSFWNNPRQAMNDEEEKDDDERKSHGGFQLTWDEK